MGWGGQVGMGAHSADGGVRWGSQCRMGVRWGFIGQIGGSDGDGGSYLDGGVRLGMGAQCRWGGQMGGSL